MKKKLYLFVCLSVVLLCSGCSPVNSALHKTGVKSQVPVAENLTENLR